MKQIKQIKQITNMNKISTKISAIAILLFVFQIGLTAQPLGSQIKTDTSGHISYWNGVDTWISVTPDLPGKNLQFAAGVPSWVNNPNGITTTASSSITGITAVSGGNILSDGGAKITARGVCWSTTPNPTVALTTKTTDGIGIGSFTTNITGLLGGTTYYVRAYAINSAGTAYGNEVSFVTTAPLVTTVTDYDGNVYDIVTIGTQEWMKQNLKTTHYKNGVAITYPGTDNTAWQNNTTGAYAWYNNDETTYKNTYGALYNWHAVNTGNLCPTGWHVPTDAEWTTLTTYLGGESIAGGKLKATTLWNSYTSVATNSSGFSALPGGYRYFDGTCYGIGGYGYWWSSTESNTTDAWYRGMTYYYSYAYSYYYDKAAGFSVRCRRD